jgi:hypothetical protein
MVRVLVTLMHCIIGLVSIWCYPLSDSFFFLLRQQLSILEQGHANLLCIVPIYSVVHSSE